MVPFSEVLHVMTGRSHPVNPPSVGRRPSHGASSPGVSPPAKGHPTLEETQGSSSHPHPAPTVPPHITCHTESPASCSHSSAHSLGILCSNVYIFCIYVCIYLFMFSYSRPRPEEWDLAGSWEGAPSCHQAKDVGIGPVMNIDYGRER